MLKSFLVFFLFVQCLCDVTLNQNDLRLDEYSNSTPELRTKRLAKSSPKKINIKKSTSTFMVMAKDSLKKYIEIENVHDPYFVTTLQKVSTRGRITLVYFYASSGQCGKQLACRSRVLALSKKKKTQKHNVLAVYCSTKQLREKCVIDVSKEAKDTSSKENTAKNKTAKDKISKEPTAKDKTEKDKTTKDKAAKVKMEKEKTVKEDTAKDKTKKDKTVKEQKVTENTAKDKVVKKNTAKENTNITEKVFRAAITEGDITEDYITGDDIMGDDIMDDDMMDDNIMEDDIMGDDDMGNDITGDIGDVNLDSITKFLAEASLQKYKIEKGTKDNLFVTKVGSQQGPTTRIFFEMAGNYACDTKKCYIDILKISSVTNVMVKLECQPAEPECNSYPLGTEVPQDPNDPKYLPLSEEALQHYRRNNHITEPVKVLDVWKVTVQITKLNKVLRIQFVAISSQNKYSCLSVHRYSNVRFRITVICTRHERQIVPGIPIVEVPRRPEFIRLATECLRAYMQRRRIVKTSLHVVKIRRVTTLPTPPKRVIRINFVVSGNHLCDELECNAVIILTSGRREINVGCRRIQRNCPLLLVNRNVGLIKK